MEKCHRILRIKQAACLLQSHWTITNDKNIVRHWPLRCKLLAEPVVKFQVPDKVKIVLFRYLSQFKLVRFAAAADIETDLVDFYWFFECEFAGS